MIDGGYGCAAVAVPTFVGLGANPEDGFRALPKSVIGRPSKMLTRRGVLIDEPVQARCSSCWPCHPGPDPAAAGTPSATRYDRYQETDA